MNRSQKLSVIAGLYGNAVEWYDFLLYASFAPIFSDLFFPSTNHFASILATFAVFAISFLMRPLGGVLLGHYADQSGRRKALIASVSIMTFATLGIAVLPGYYSFGVAAPFLFVVLRLIQGMAVGGELPGSTTFLIEHMSKKSRGFAGSLILGSAFLGIFFGSLIASLLSNLFTNEFLIHWGWRIAYLIGSLLGVIGIYLRIHSVESAEYENTVPTNDFPAVRVLAHYRAPLILATLLTSIMAIGNYALIAYITAFLVKTEGVLLKDALAINFIALFFITVLIPMMGYLSDLIDKKTVFLMGLIGLVVCTFPMFWLLMSHNWWYILLGELLLSLVMAPLNATVPPILSELFPTEVRASGISIGYNLGQAIFGGTVPLVALALIEFTGNKYAPACYILFWALFVLISILRIPKRAKCSVMS